MHRDLLTPQIWGNIRSNISPNLRGLVHSLSGRIVQVDAFSSIGRAFKVIQLGHSIHAKTVAKNTTGWDFLSQLQFIAS